MNAKQTILTQLRKHQSSLVEKTKPLDYQPKIINNLPEYFKNAAIATSSEVIPISAIDEIPSLIAQRMPKQKRLRCWSEFNTLNWQKENIEIHNGSAEKSDRFGLTSVDMAIASTGSVILIADKHKPQSVAVLPEHHFALVKCSQIKPTLIETMHTLATTNAKNAAQLVFISGPSRTADIEQTLILGVHGPLKVTLFLLT